MSLIIYAGYVCAQAYHAESPDGKIRLTVNADKEITWQVDHEDTRVIVPSAISLHLSGGEVYGKRVKVTKVSRNTVNTSFETPFYKKDKVIDHYSQLLLKCGNNYSLEFRVYNDGVAYRFITNQKDELTILNEEANFNFASDYKAFVPYINDMRGGERYTYSFESFYDEIKLSEIKQDSLSIVPLLVDLGNGKKVAVMEADVEDFPGLFLTSNPENKYGLKGAFAPYPLEGEMGGYNFLNFVPTKRADYIAKIKGPHALPWRAIVISTKDTDLANNDMMQKLASPSRIEDMSWIQPGKVAWDWWNNWNITHVDFKAGMNTQTYKYYIDFASSNKLEYIIIDWGWAPESLMNPIPEMDIKEIVDYGKQKNVGVILWAGWHPADKEKEIAFPHYARMGIKGFKVDFFDSDDQKMIQTVYALAEKAAEHKLLLDLHGMKATGIQRTYPNVVNFEGVKGLENFKWAPIINGEIKDDALRYDVTIPYIRMLAGPMDYTPGAMQNANKANYRSINDRPMSQGTRVHQMAMYTVFEAPLQMLADSPTAYMREQECTDFIAKVPTVFDQTLVLDGEVGEYIVIARKKGDIWYIGAMTNWNTKNYNLDFSFLGEGNFEAEIFKDGINSDKEPTDYVRKITPISYLENQTIEMYPGGGWTARIYPVK